MLNQKTIDIKIYNGVEENRVLAIEKSMEATQLANTVANLLQEKFRQFLFSDPQREEEMVRIYNRKFNSFVAPVYNGEQLYLTGTNPTIQLRKNQKDAIARILYEPTTLLYHEVGTGKTFSLIAGAMESKKIGRASKPLIVVPKKIIGQFEQNAYKLYPNAKILVLNNEDVQRKNRLKTLTKVANNEWDIVIMADTTFKGVSVNPEIEKNFLEKMLDEYRWELEHTEEISFTQKHIQKMIATYENKIEEISDRVKQGVGSTTGITMDELGIDMLLIDEAHNYKNLPIAGINSPSSQRAFDLYIKTRWLFDKLGEEKNVVFATGTALSTM